MTNEASTMVVVARAALEGALRAALPHVARKIPEDAPDNGAGLMRLAVVQDCVMVLAVAIDRKRAIAVRFNVLDGDSYSDGVKSMWLRRSAVESLATFLAGVPVERVSLLLDEREGVTVQETGVLYGPQMARVAPAAEPMDEDRVDAARLLLDGAHGVLYQDAAVEMDPAVVPRSRRRRRPGRFLCVSASVMATGGPRSSGALMRASGGPLDQCCFRPL